MKRGYRVYGIALPEGLQHLVMYVFFTIAMLFSDTVGTVPR